MVHQKTLTRFTIAPQVSISDSFWGRPVIRAFYSQTFWNRANRGTIDSSGPYAGKTSGASWDSKQKFGFN